MSSFVGQRVHHLAERGDLVASSREIAVQPVGQGREAEDGGADEFLADAQDQPAFELGQQNHDEQRDEEDPDCCQGVRQVQARRAHWSGGHARSDPSLESRTL